MLLKKILGIFVFVLFIFPISVFPNEIGVPIIPDSSLKAYQYTLNNGLKLIVIPDYRNTLATLNFILDAGSDREVLGQTGLAHFFEHMMFRKTTKSAEGNYDRVLGSVGGSGNAGTSDSLVTFYSTFPAPALKSMLELESERFLNLSLKEPYFNTEKSAVISERKMRVENDPFQRGNEVNRSIVERGTPLEWMVIGAKKDIMDLNILTAQNFYNNFYRPNNALVVIGGPFKSDEVKALVIEYFGKWQGTAPKNEVEYPKDYLTRDIGKSYVCGEPVSTKNVQFVYPSYDGSMKSVVYSWLFNAMLDDSPQGSFEYRLQMQQLADRFAFAKSYDGTKSNPFVASFVLSSNQKIENLKQFWDKSVNETLNRTLPKNIIEQVIKQQKVNNANIAERLSNVAGVVTENAYFFKDPAAQITEMKILQSVTQQDFSNWMKENFAQPQGHGSSGKLPYYTTGIVPLKEAPNCEK